MRDAGHRMPDIGRRTSDGEKNKNNISTPQGGGHNNRPVCWLLNVVITHSPPISEIGVQIPARPQVGKLVIACGWLTVYSTEL